MPAGLSEPRLEAEVDAQQVTSVERGYNLYEANCARCHGANGEGGIGPVAEQPGEAVRASQRGLPPQHAHRGRPLRLRRPESLMPVWSIRATRRAAQLRPDRGPHRVHPRAKHETFVKRDPELLDPEIDPLTGKVETFQGWRDPNYARPRARRRSRPAGTIAPRTSPSAGARASRRHPPRRPRHRAAGRRAGRGAGRWAPRRLDIAARTSPSRRPTLEGAGRTAVLDPLRQQGRRRRRTTSRSRTGPGRSSFKGEIFPGVATKDYTCRRSGGARTPFVCTVHPNMTGTLTAG